jgi:hypothetical protein
MRINPNDGRYRMHYGEDTLGAGNYAPVDGVVVFAGYDHTGTGLGYAVGIREAADSSVIWWVAHHASLAVTVGDITREGATFLGVKGASGAAKGVHCHTERRVSGAARPGSGRATDPRDYYTTTAANDIEPITDPLEETMKVYAIRNGDGSGSIGTVNPDGTLDGLTGDEYAALARLGLLEGGDFHQQSDGTVWNILTARTARVRAHGTDIDETALAAQIAPLVVGPVVAAVRATAGVHLTEEQVQAASEAALRQVLGGLG